MAAMRINLKCPFSEKDQAKALGARWDPARKVWYVENAADLAPFARWLAGVQQVNEDRPEKIGGRKKRGAKRAHRPPAGGCTTVGKDYVEDLAEYEVPPWEEVDDWQSIKALREACA